MSRTRKLYVSQPMANRSEEDILSERADMMAYACAKLDCEFREIPKTSPRFMKGHHPAECLGQSIQLMAQADMVVFAPGWDSARGCIIEHAVCDAYKIPYIEG